MKKILIAAALLLTPLAAGAQTTANGPDAASDEPIPAVVPVQQGTYVRPDAKTRRARYVKSIFGWASLAGTAFSAGWGTYRNSPSEWGKDLDGFGKRAASSFGKKVISRSIRYGMDEALTLDSQFYRTKKKGIGSRIANALISPVTARKANGRRTIGVPRLVGTYTAHVVAAEAWYPDRYTYKDGLRSATKSLGTTALINLFKEFVRF